MTLFMRCILVLAVSLGALTGLLWTPDTAFDDMRLKYGGGDSQFLALANGDRLHYRDRGGSGGEVLLLSLIHI